ncbi:maleylpyruvate isomerase N-terminal domain-containing protein [Embleya sp. NPDC001921]
MARGATTTKTAPAAQGWPQLVIRATEVCVAALTRAAAETGAGAAEGVPAEADHPAAVHPAAFDPAWGRPADGERSCRQLLDHLALGLVGYTGLLIARPTDRYITLFASLDPAAPIVACLDGLGIAGTVLASTVRDTPPEVRAWHPWGHSDRIGFAAMGVVELLLHTYDITRALGQAWSPPDELATPALARLFPDAPTGTGDAPGDVLLWCTGRGDLPGRPRVPAGEWQWQGSVR